MPTWMFRTKEAEAARIAAQREQRQLKGLCIRCGFTWDPGSRQLCTRHLQLQREAQQRLKAGRRGGRRG